MKLRVARNLIGDRLDALPLAIVYVTERCNSRCVTCDFWRHGEKSIPVERARRLARELRRMGTEMVLLTGGEVFMHPRWDEVASAFREQGLRLWLLTAGLSLAREASVVARLCERITVSLDGATRETYRAIRGVDALHEVCEGIRAALGQNVWVSLRATIQRGNYKEMPALVLLARKLGVRQISFLPVDVTSQVAFARRRDDHRGLALRREDLDRFSSVLDSLERDFAEDLASKFIAERPAKLRRLHQYFAALAGKSTFPPVRCNVPRFSAVVRPDGEWQPCYFIPGVGQGPAFAKAAAGLHAVLNRPALRELRRSIRAGERKECERCVCSMWKGARELVLQGIGEAI